MSTRDDLLVSGDDAVNQRLLLDLRNLTVPQQHAQIVDAFQNNQVTNAGRRQRIVVKACQSVRSEAIEQKTVPADAFVQNSDRSRRRIGLQALGEQIRPSVISVGGGTMAVGDGVTER